MLKFQIKTKDDLREAVAIQRRRRFEEERKKRIFDARQRVLGVDIDGLEKQIEEKKRMQSEEKSEEEKYLRELKEREHLILRKTIEFDKERRRVERETQLYRELYQKPESRKEFDLNDPNASKKKTCNEPKLIPNLSGCQKFEGEDLFNDERRKMQQEQQRAWLEQQINEKKKIDEERKRTEDLLSSNYYSRLRQAKILEKNENLQRRNFNQSIIDFNMKMVKEKQKQREEDKKHEEEDNMAEIYNMLTSDILTENREIAQSALSSSRKIPCLFKGMSEEESRGYRKEQLKQIREKQQNKELEHMNKEQWGRIYKDNIRTANLQEYKLNKLKMEQMEEIRRQNKQMAEQQRQKRAYFNKVVYTNVPSDEYYAQFNKDAR